MNVNVARDPAMEVTRTAIAKQKLVYVIVADKKIKYPNGRSRIAYVGTTRKGVGRIARSVAYRAPFVLEMCGVRKFTVRVLTCTSRQRVKTWHKLERAILIMFKEIYGKPPELNVQGKKMKETDEFSYFARRRIRTTIEDLS